MNSVKKIVLKFGGSVLHSQSNFAGIASEIRRFASNGYQVVAVVSAYYGVTEELISRADKLGIDPNSVEYAELIATGEQRSATELTSYLLTRGVNVISKMPRELDFRASGQRNCATPSRIDKAKLSEALDHSPIVIVPGFSAVDENGGCVLLGRGGSDISAVCIAEALDLDGVRLIKDVDGLYDVDPNKFKEAKRLEYVDYAIARKIAGELIQAEAIDFAASKNMRIDIAGVNQSYSSRIGAKRVEKTAPTPQELDYGVSNDSPTPLDEMQQAT